MEMLHHTYLADPLGLFDSYFPEHKLGFWGGASPDEKREILSWLRVKAGAFSVAEAQIRGFGDIWQVMKLVAYAKFGKMWARRDLEAIGVDWRKCKF